MWCVIRARGLEYRYVLIHTGRPADFGFLLSYIVSVGTICWGDVVGAFLAEYCRHFAAVFP
jgi:hypothetical protein